MCRMAQVGRRIIMNFQLSASRSRVARESEKMALFAVVAAALAVFMAYPAGLRAQSAGGAMPPAVAALTGGQRSAANNALCAALASQMPNPASATPSALSSPGVISAAATMFAGGAKLPLSSATSMLQGYVGRHATEILASCATSNMTSKIPGASNIPSMP